ncbi:recombinase family protein [Listeria weihenstephanensis]|uniref:Recombinase family protein n=1 Tax=Listeria weihenstephanensis TaxID=1006155 RepID=A0A841Z8S2_9LIST|nr:recombinase family protein [Listeria weihenstephanensis]MBC1501249.1 recombinase family protein [Listeria weihenstephanensis]
MKQQQSKNTTGIYLRLSRDDETNGESMSISSQRQLLRNYAKEQGFTIVREYVDDGYSGTNFNRPGFNEMKADIEDGKLSIVITKDLSRLGRNYLETGYLTEVYFSEHNVRFIAVQDSVDTFGEENEFMPFRNIMNEWYAKDNAKKVRAGYRIKAIEGKFTGGYAPYGYEKDPLDIHKLVIDKEVAPVIKKIFSLAIAGYSSFKICKTLKAESILTPRSYLYLKTGKYAKTYDPAHPYDWGTTIIRRIIANEVYLGHMVSGITSTKSFKDKRLIRHAPEDWIKVENTHEAIIDAETFEEANKNLSVRKHMEPQYPDDPNIYTGILRCSTCRSVMSLARESKVKYTSGNYMCGKFRTRGKEYCSMHYINRKNLNRLVLEDIQYHIRETQLDEKKLIKKLNKYDKEKSSNSAVNYGEQLKTKKARQKELDIILKKLFEEYALGKITETQFNLMAGKFNDEHEQVVQDIDNLNEKIRENSDDEDKNKRFVQLLKNYTEATELDSNLLHSLVDTIIVYDSEVIDGQRTQRVDIHYKFAGVIKSSEVYTSPQT